MDADTSVDLWLSFLAGLSGSTHCVGMCGAIVLAYSAQGRTGVTRISTLAAHLAYNGGRVFSYVVVGAILGLVGKGIFLLQGVGYWFSLGSGIILIVSGLALLRLLPAIRFSDSVALSTSGRSILEKAYRASFGLLIAAPKLESKFYLGLLTPLLPCGLLYSMFLKAAGTGDPVGAGAVMLMFGLGIVPSLVATGFAGTFLGERTRQWGERIAGITVVVMGISLLARSLNLHIPFVPPHHP